jgi:O-antigen ligase
MQARTLERTCMAASPSALPDAVNGGGSLSQATSSTLLRLERWLSRALALVPIAVVWNGLLPFPAPSNDYFFLKHEAYAVLALPLGFAVLVRSLRGRPLLALPAALVACHWAAAVASGPIAGDSHRYELEIARLSTTLLLCLWIASGGCGLALHARALLTAHGLVLAGTLPEIFARWQPLLHDAPFPGGMLGNRNTVSIYLVQGFPLLLWLATAGRSRGLRWAAGAAATLGVYVAIAFRTRSAWIMLATSLLVILAGAARKPGPHRRALLLVALSSIGIGVAGAATIPNALRWRAADPLRESLWSLLSADQGHGRPDLWRVALHMTVSEPLHGVGAGQFSVFFPEHLRRTFAQRDRFPARTEYHAHNAYLHAAAELGIPGGLILSLATLGLGGWLLVAATARGDASSLALTAVVLATAANAFVDSPLHDVTTAQGFYVALALGARRVGRRGARAARVPGFVPALLVLALSLGSGAVGGRGLLRAFLVHVHAASGSLGALERAGRVVPGHADTRTALVEAHLSTGDAERARVHAEALVRLEPFSWESHWRLSRTLRQDGAPGAAQALERAFALANVCEPRLLETARRLDSTSRVDPALGPCVEPQPGTAPGRTAVGSSNTRKKRP